jgi:hypothetical protein
MVSHAMERLTRYGFKKAVEIEEKNGEMEGENK